MKIFRRFLTDPCINANSEKIFSMGRIISILLIIIVVICFVMETVILETGIFFFARLTAFLPALFFLICSATFSDRISKAVKAASVLTLHLCINIMNAMIIYIVYTNPGLLSRFESSAVIVACITFILQIVVGKGLKKWIPLTMIIPAIFLTIAMFLADLTVKDLSVFSTYHFFLFIAVVILITEDRLERREHANRLVEMERNEFELQNKYKNEFISNISHELRTPLNGIIGLHELLKETNLNEEQRGYIDLARQCSYHLLDMINDLLDINSLEEKRITLKYERINLKDFSEEIFKSFSSINKKDIRFVFQSDLDIETFVMTDPKRLRQVISNLLGNAEKFTNSGMITLSLIQKEKTSNSIDVLFSVTDTGIGIPSEKIPFIFDRFYQIDKSPTRKYSGTGLGLAISKMIVEMMGGKIWCESIEKTGSSFKFSLKFLID